MRSVGALPHPASSFFGRADDVARLEALHDRGERLVTLVGPPGVGKTRLALEYARRAREHARVSFCDASESRSSWDVVACVAAALGVPVTTTAGETAAIAQVAYALASLGDALVVLDNVEQVLEPAARVIRVFREAAPELRLLVTSREPLGIAGEAALAVDPLRDDEGARLFAARAEAVAPGFRAEGVELDAVREIVRRLDGLPLAIELAAPRIRVTAPSGLIAHLSRQLDLLRSNEVGRPSRHASLRAALDWSWELLSAEERDGLCRLALFAGRFSAKDVAAVLAPTEQSPLEALDLLEALQRRSLVTSQYASGAEPAFVLLQPVREFAIEAGRALDLRDAAQAHARHYAELLDGARPGDLSAVVENAIAAHARCLETEPELAARIALGVERVVSEGRPVDRRLDMLDRTLEAAGAIRSPRLLAELSCARAEARRAATQIEGAFDDARAAVAESESAGAADLGARASCILAQLYAYGNRWDEAFEHAERALRLAEASGSERALVNARRVLGYVIATSGRPADEARAHLHRALMSAITLGDRQLEAHVLVVLGELEQTEGHLEEARALREQALALHREVGDRAAEGLTLLNLAYTHLESGDWQRAATQAREARTKLRELGHRRLEILALVCQGSALAQRGELEEALACARDAVRLAPGAGDYAVALATLNLGVVEALRGGLGASRAAFDAIGGLLASAPSALFATVLDLSEGFYDLALARAAASRGERHEEERLLARVRERTSGSLHREPSDVRVVRGMLRHALARHADPAAAPAPHTARSERELRIERTGRWFEREGKHVTLASRPVLRRLLVALAKESLAHPGAPMTFAALVAAGWPEERILAHAATRRLHVMISRLRDTGLRDLVRGDPDGYFLDPASPVALVDDAAS